jgi:hypothetical protein
MYLKKDLLIMLLGRGFRLMKLNKSIILVLMTVFLFSSCNALKLITGGETKVDPNFSRKSCGESSSLSSLYSGLDFFWRFNEAQSLSKVDITNNLTLADSVTGGVPMMSGPRGNALNCAGQASTIGFLNASYTHAKSATDNYAFSFWAYLPSNVTCSAYNTIMNFGTASDYIMFKNADCAGDASDIQVRIGATDFNVVDVADFTGGAWKHFVINVISGGSSVEVYVDGNFVNSTSGTGIATTTGSNFSLCSDNGGGQTHNGGLDSVGFWSRTLNQNEIYELAGNCNPLD